MIEVSDFFLSRASNKNVVIWYLSIQIKLETTKRLGSHSSVDNFAVIIIIQTLFPGIPRPLGKFLRVSS